MERPAEKLRSPTVGGDSPRDEEVGGRAESLQKVWPSRPVTATWPATVRVPLSVRMTNRALGAGGDDAVVLAREHKRVRLVDEDAAAGRVGGGEVGDLGIERVEGGADAGAGGEEYRSGGAPEVGGGAGQIVQDGAASGEAEGAGRLDDGTWMAPPAV